MTQEMKDKSTAIWMAQTVETIKSFKEGEKLVIVASRNTPFYESQIVTAVTDTIEGIFPDRPFITVRGDNTSPFTIHASRLIRVSDLYK